MKTSPGNDLFHFAMVNQWQSKRGKVPTLLFSNDNDLFAFASVKLGHFSTFNYILIRITSHLFVNHFSLHLFVKTHFLGVANLYIPNLCLLSSWSTGIRATNDGPNAGILPTHLSTHLGKLFFYSVTQCSPNYLHIGPLGGQICTYNGPTNTPI